MSEQYPATVSALIERIKLDACHGMGDLPSQCCASLSALEATQAENDALRAANRDLQHWFDDARAEAEGLRARVAELERCVDDGSDSWLLRKQAEAVAFSAHLFPEAEQESIRRALYDHAETLRQQADELEQKQ